MANLLEIELENAINRYIKLSNTKRGDTIARIVLNRMQEEITNLERRIKNERRPGKENATCSSAGTFTQYARKALHNYWLKCHSDNSTVLKIPEFDTI
jgi:hypothetical protein